MKKLYRSQRNKKIAGICGGIAEMTDTDPTIIRLIVVVLALVTGFLSVTCLLGGLFQLVHRINVLLETFCLVYVVVHYDNKFKGYNNEKQNSDAVYRTFPVVHNGVCADQGETDGTTGQNIFICDENNRRKGQTAF